MYPIHSKNPQIVPVNVALIEQTLVFDFLQRMQPLCKNYVM